MNELNAVTIVSIIPVSEYYKIRNTGFILRIQILIIY